MNSVQTILNLLQDKGLKQKDLASYLGISQSAIADWKKGKTKSYMRYLPQIASFLNVSIEDIIDTNEIYSYISKNISDKFESVQNDNLSLYKQSNFGNMHLVVKDNKVMVESTDSDTFTPLPPNIQSVYNKLSDRSKLEVQIFIIDQAKKEEQETE